MKCSLELELSESGNSSKKPESTLHASFSSMRLTVFFPVSGGKATENTVQVGQHSTKYWPKLTALKKTKILL